MKWFSFLKEKLCMYIKNWSYIFKVIFLNTLKWRLITIIIDCYHMFSKILSQTFG